jgi:hypothetical protein
MYPIDLLKPLERISVEQVGTRLTVSGSMKLNLVVLDSRPFQRSQNLMRGLVTR